MVVPPHLRPRSGPYSGLTFRSAKRFLTKQFAAVDLPFADEDALDLLLGLTGLSRTDYTLRGTEFISEADFAALQSAAEQRLSGVPVDRILGWRDFYGRRFVIDNVLSPRGDTEVLLLAALDAIRDRETPHILDLGTGSGALALTLLCERPDAIAVATDKDEAALTTAHQNAKSLSVADRVTLIQSDWFERVSAIPFDLIISNPPYITTQAMTSLETEVAQHDPDLALHGGIDGLNPYRVIIRGARDYLKPGGWLAVEIGFDQGEAVVELFSTSGFEAVLIHHDPAGHDRTVIGRCPK